MSSPRAACGPVEGFVRPSLGFRCSKISYILTTCPYFDNVDFDIFDAGVVFFSANLSRLLPLQLGFERFQHICLSYI